MDWGAIVSWSAVGLIALSLIWSSFLRRREVERTLRLAIERGQVLDAAMLRQFRGRSERTPEHLVAGGAVLGALALGTVVFAFAAGQDDTDALLPLLGIAAVLACPAAALAACGFWLMRLRGKDSRV